MEEEAKTFVKVVRATDPQAPCPKCVTEDHNVCSTSLRSVCVGVAPPLSLREVLCFISKLTTYYYVHSDADDAYEAAAGPDDSKIDPEVSQGVPCDLNPFAYLTPPPSPPLHRSASASS